ncbi:MAG: adenosylcobinamide-GDP ribazoletransferase [Armatimonadota bacterium]|nr:adenosylcobinamide-GDP ribazoletransferase [Armatimonadota bacterium]MCX7777102.1 adenosylcobinamide-GDP ribazoletransferase [Armatimonadota bacterium]MDW8025149.1 adenosylcobinamide-GDP ribazoletransferase [Armatimonadota bacterium]
MSLKAILLRMREVIRLHVGALFCAVSFLTVVPVHGLCPKDAIKVCGWLFPLVGLIIGAVVATADSVLLSLVPMSVVSAITVSMFVIITGGLHLDGLADLIDAIGSRKSGEEQLKVMREPQIGAFGAAGIFIVLLLKYALIVSLEPNWRWTAILLSPMFGRYSAVVSMFLFPYARSEEGIAYHLRGHRIGQTVAATIYTAAATQICASYAGHICMWQCVALSILISWRLVRRFGGLTGDCYGAIVEVCEVTSLLAFVMLQRFTNA